MSADKPKAVLNPRDSGALASQMITEYGARIQRAIAKGFIEAKNSLESRVGKLMDAMFEELDLAGRVKTAHVINEVFGVEERDDEIEKYADDKEKFSRKLIARINSRKEYGADVFGDFLASVRRKAHTLPEKHPLKTFKSPETQEYIDKYGNIYPASLGKLSASDFHQYTDQLGLLLNGEDPSPRKPKSPNAFDVSKWFAEKNVTDIALQLEESKPPYFYATAYPELRVNISNPRLKDKTEKELTDFQRQLVQYTGLLEEAQSLGLNRIDADGVVHLSNADISIQKALKGKPSEVIKTIKSAISQQEKINEPRAPKAAKIKPVTDPPIAAAEVSMSAPAVVRSNAHIRIDPTHAQLMPRIELDEQTSQSYFALHNQQYTGSVPTMKDGKFAVILDSGILLRCFGKSADEKTRKFALELFNSLLENPKIGAIIIPDYIANIEASGVFKSYHNDQQSFNGTVRVENKVDGEYYRPQLQNMLKRALCRHVNADGSISYNKDRYIKDENVIPKLIIWENDKGQELLKKYKEQHADNNKIPKGKHLGEDFGEEQIESIIASPDFPAKNIAVITTDYNYVTDHKNDKDPEGKNVCRMNLNHYIGDLISSDPLATVKWANLSGFTQQADDHHGFNSQLYEHILIRFVEHLNGAMKEKEESDTVTTFKICTNPELSKQIFTGDTPHSQTSADVVRKAVLPLATSITG